MCGKAWTSTCARTCAFGRPSSSARSLAAPVRAVTRSLIGILRLGETWLEGSARAFWILLAVEGHRHPHARMCRVLSPFGVELRRHSLDDHLAEALRLAGARLGLAPDAIVLDDEMGALSIRFQEHADWTLPARIGVFERVQHEFGDYDPDRHGLVRIHLDRLGVKRQRSGLAILG